MENKQINKAEWTKVSQLAVGMEIGVPRDGLLDRHIAGGLAVREDLSDNDVVWDEIVEINHVGREQVYDIEVEGTHNFIGNNIFAHNTYISGNTGIGTSTPTTKLEVQGTASASYLLTGNTLQVGGFASAAYSRFGTDTTGYTNFITTTNDLLISGDLEVNATAQFDSFVRISNSSTRALVVTDTGGTKQDIFVVDTTASTSNSGITITAGTAQTGALFELKSSGGTLLTKFSDEGGLNINVSSTSAFVIHNGSGVRALVFDSSAGTASISGQLTITVDGDAAGVDALCGSTALNGDVGDVKGETILDCSGAPTSDYAEIYPTADDVEFGDLVAVSDILVQGKKVVNNRVIEGETITLSKLVKASSSYDPNIIGVTSNNYGDFSSVGHGVVDESDNPLPVALSGRVPVKTSLESGPIKPGDRLTSSSTPGVAMKATEAGIIVGVALEPLDFITSGSYTKTLVFVNPGYWAPSFAKALEGTALTAESGAIFDLDILFNSIVKKFSEAMSIVFENGLLKIASIIADKITAKEVAAEKLCIGQTCVTEQELKALLEQSGMQTQLTPAPTPSPSESPTPTPQPSPEASAGTPSESPTPEPSPSESPTPTPEPTPTPSESPTPEPTPESTPESGI